MGFMEFLGLGKREAERIEAALPSVAQPPSLPAPPSYTVNGGGAQAGIMESSAGGPSLTWANYDTFRQFTAGYPRYGWWGVPGGEIAREQATASSIALDLVQTNPLIASLVDQLATYAVGCGLTLSSRPDYAALGIDQATARELSHRIETAWATWSNSPNECDASGRHSLPQLAVAGFKSWLLQGESAFAIDWQRSLDATTGTKINMLDPRQLAYEVTRITDREGHALQGIQFDQRGRVSGYWIRPFVLGSFATAPMPVFVRARTSWGRVRLGHVFDLVIPGQVRGVSPLAAALTPSRSREVLNEYTLAAALIQSMVAITVESDLDQKSAIGQLATQDQLFPAQPPQGVSAETWLQTKQAYYDQVQLNLKPGTVNHLLRGDKLHFNKSQSPNTTHESFDASLVRQAAKAAGSSYEDVSGDFSKTSFSASRLSLELPWRITKRRRQAIVEPFYRAAYQAWLEEMCETGRLKLPAGAPAFWENPAAYGNAVWRGDAKPTADPYRTAQADVLELQHGLATLEQKLGERGLDMEETLAQRKAEREQCEAAGLPYPTPTGVVAANEPDEEALK